MCLKVVAVSGRHRQQEPVPLYSGEAIISNSVFRTLFVEACSMWRDLAGRKDRFIVCGVCQVKKKHSVSLEQVRSNGQSSGREARDLLSTPSGCFCKINGGKLRQEEPCAHSLEMAGSLPSEVITTTFVYSELCTVLSSPVAWLPLTVWSDSKLIGRDLTH